MLCIEWPPDLHFGLKRSRHWHWHCNRQLSLTFRKELRVIETIETIFACVRQNWCSSISNYDGMRQRLHSHSESSHYPRAACSGNLWPLVSSKLPYVHRVMIRLVSHDFSNSTASGMSFVISGAEWQWWSHPLVAGFLKRSFRSTSTYSNRFGWW